MNCISHNLTATSSKCLPFHSIYTVPHDDMAGGYNIMAIMLGLICCSWLFSFHVSCKLKLNVHLFIIIPVYPTLLLYCCFYGGGFLIPISLHFYKVSLLFLLFFPLYSFLQAGRFTTKRQRESPINLVANHALDSSVDLCLCPSVCIFFFSISSHCIHLHFI